MPQRQKHNIFLARQPRPKPPHNQHQSKSTKKQSYHLKTQGVRLFQSSKFTQHHKKQSWLSQKQGMKGSNKVITTDESNGYESNIQQSIFLGQNKSPNQEYFQCLSFRPKKQKIVVNRNSINKQGINKSKANSRIDSLSCKIREMEMLVHSQDKEIRVMKQSVSEKELHRLIKIHSIQKLKLISSIKEDQSITVRRRQRR